MESNSYKRRRFLGSVAIGTLGFTISRRAFSLGNVVKTSGGIDLLSYVDVNGKKRRVTTLSEWKIKRRQILDGMQGAMGKLPDISGLPVPDFQVLDQLTENNYTRLTIRITVEKEERLPAYLYVPIQKGAQKRLPAMLALHETDPLGKQSVDGRGKGVNLGYAKELAQKGYVVIAPDYPGYGDLRNYDFENDRYQSGTMKSIFDGMRCIDLLQSRSDVDPERIGVIGHSLGGHSAMFVGAFDTRLKVVVSSSGWTLFDYDNMAGTDRYIERYGGRLGDWATQSYMPLLRDKYHLDSEKFPFDFDEVIAAIAPRGFFSSSPMRDSDFDFRGVKAGIAETHEVYAFLGAPDMLQAFYPESVHDFPPEAHLEAYRFIDRTLKHVL